MSKAFFLETKIIPCPIVREKSGLDCSSRNRMLSAAGLIKAPLFYKRLSSGLPVEIIRKQLEADGFRVDYVTKNSGRIYGAVFLENVRLIDNVECFC